MLKTRYFALLLMIVLVLFVAFFYIEFFVDKNDRVIARLEEIDMDYIEERDSGKVFAIVSINPESKMSLSKLNDFDTGTCKEDRVVFLRILNNSFSTFSIAITLDGVGDAGASVRKLSGERHEYRAFRMRIDKKVSIAKLSMMLTADDAWPNDLGGRSKISLYVRCA